MIVIDASVLIAHLAGSGVQAGQAASILDTEEELMLHPLTVAEGGVAAARLGQLSTFRGAITRLGISIWQPDTDHPYRLAQLRATTSLKLPDCCVLDTARTTAATLATFDQALAATAISLRITVVGVPVTNEN